MPFYKRSNKYKTLLAKEAARRRHMDPSPAPPCRRPNIAERISMLQMAQRRHKGNFVPPNNGVRLVLPDEPRRPQPLANTPITPPSIQHTTCSSNNKYKKQISNQAARTRTVNLPQTPPGTPNLAERISMLQVAQQRHKGDYIPSDGIRMVLPEATSTTTQQELKSERRKGRASSPLGRSKWGNDSPKRTVKSAKKGAEASGKRKRFRFRFPRISRNNTGKESDDEVSVEEITVKQIDTKALA